MRGQEGENGGPDGFVAGVEAEAEDAFGDFDG